MTCPIPSLYQTVLLDLTKSARDKAWLNMCVELIHDRMSDINLGVKYLV